MIIYGSSMSPFVRKVLAFGAEKGLELDYKPLQFGADDPEFRAASPFGKIPAFRDGDFAISDSSAIIAYLDAVQPEPNLIPAEPRARARTIWFEEFADTILMDCGRRMFFHRIVGPRFMGVAGDETVAAAAQAELPRYLDYLEEAIAPSGFLVEDRLTLADLAVASPFVNFQHLGLPVDPARHPKTATYVEAMLARPSFATWVAKEVRFMERMATAA